MKKSRSLSLSLETKDFYTKTSVIDHFSNHSKHSIF